MVLWEEPGLVWQGELGAARQEELGMVQQGEPGVVWWEGPGLFPSRWAPPGNRIPAPLGPPPVPCCRVPPPGFRSRARPGMGHHYLGRRPAGGLLLVVLHTRAGLPPPSGGSTSAVYEGLEGCPVLHPRAPQGLYPRVQGFGCDRCRGASRGRARQSLTVRRGADPALACLLCHAALAADD